MSSQNIIEFYKDYLLSNVLPFWLKNGIDSEYGGILTHLDRSGEIYSTDKSVWFQGRALWTFSKVYNSIDKNSAYINAAKNIYQFLKKCYDSDGRMFFLTTRDGRAIQKRRYYFSETFAAIGCAEYYKATGDKEALALAEASFAMAEKLYRNPLLTQPKYNPETLNLKALASPMILMSTAQVLRGVSSNTHYDSFITEMAEEILNGGFYNVDKQALFEHVSATNEPLQGPKSRLVNPGHSVEAAWFLMIEAIRRKDKELLAKAKNILDWSMRLGRDEKYGGILHFVDVENKPLEQLEWDMKLWWPHTEAVFANYLAWRATGDEAYKKNFEEFHEYAFEHFEDKEYGEWYGYLHRDGSISNTLKGNTYKGPFHLPRLLILMVDLASRETLDNYFPL